LNYVLLVEEAWFYTPMAALTDDGLSLADHGGDYYHPNIVLGHFIFGITGNFYYTALVAQHIRLERMEA